ncbi:hypothetical protein E0I74_11825 [Rhizobium laguerreae]|nr:hypothetical protein E0I74_11825 [Rhizobium laguerreae]TBY02939.1 hypothetical protein E0I94_29710 [Rhizobium laguerreae]
MLSPLLKATDVIISDFTSYSGRIFRVLSQVLHGLCPGQFVQGVWLGWHQAVGVLLGIASVTLMVIG